MRSWSIMVRNGPKAVTAAAVTVTVTVTVTAAAVMVKKADAGGSQS